MGGRIPELIDLASQLFDLAPRVDFALLQRPPLVDQLRQGVDLRLDGLDIGPMEDIGGVLRLIEVLLGAFLAHDEVLKRRLTDGHALESLLF